MVVIRYDNHVLSTFNCMPQHYIHNMYCYKTYHYKRYTKYKYILLLLILYAFHLVISQFCLVGVTSLISSESIYPNPYFVLQVCTKYVHQLWYFNTT